MGDSEIMGAESQKYGMHAVNDKGSHVGRSRQFLPSVLGRWNDFRWRQIEYRIFTGPGGKQVPADEVEQFAQGVFGVSWYEFVTGFETECGCREFASQFLWCGNVNTRPSSTASASDRSIFLRSRSRSRTFARRSGMSWLPPQAYLHGFNSRSFRFDYLPGAAPTAAKAFTSSAFSGRLYTRTSSIWPLKNAPEPRFVESAAPRA